MGELELEELAWAFVRGDASAADLRARRRAAARAASAPLRGLFGDLDAALAGDLDELRTWLAGELEAGLPEGCHCPRLRDREVLDLAGPLPPSPALGPARGWTADVLTARIETLAERGEPCPWLSAAACGGCGQGWLVAREDRHNEVLCLVRIDDGVLEAIGAEGLWPESLDTYEELLRHGRASGRFVEYEDPLDSPLGDLIRDLALERPGISVSDLEELLNVDSAVCTTLARRAMTQGDCRIDLDR